MNVLLSIGCDRYASLPGLAGAERDALRIYETLTKAPNSYDSELSVLLLSPLLASVESALAGMSNIEEVDVLTCFFAGHGAVKSGNYYLCVSDSQHQSLSTSAWAIGRLLNFVAEKCIRHVNIIIDSCEAAGAMLDFQGILRSEVVGKRGGSSISVLAASGSNESAHEHDGDGVLTNCLLEYLGGTKKVQAQRPYLDLVEVGRAVSADLTRASSRQTPISWGLNLYGQAAFAANPYFSASEGEISLVGIPPNSDLGQLIYTHSDRLWNEYRLILEDQSPRRLRDTLQIVTEGLRTDVRKLFSFVRGFSSTLKDRAALSQDLLGEYNAVATCALCLLPSSAEAGVALMVKDFARELSDIARSVRAELVTALRNDIYCLLGKSGVLADLFYLPIRVSRLLSWLGLTIILDRLMGLEEEPDIRDYEFIVREIVDHYSGSVVAMSDAQAVALYLFAKASSLFPGDLQAGKILGMLLDSFASIDGRVAKIGISGDDALRYLIARSRDFQEIPRGIMAKPTQFLAALLLVARDAGIADAVDLILVALDHSATHLFFPEDYSDFASNRIEKGCNRLYLVGSDFWRLQEFVGRVKEECAKNVASDPKIRERHVQVLCLLAAYFFPDRLPLFLEEVPELSREV